jgi:nucleoside-diphosphate-sugar epimerase
MTEKSHIFLAGASRGVGLEIAKCLAAQKMQVTALLRSPATSTELEAMGIKVVTGDALDAAAMEAAMAGGEPIHAVISTIGSLPKDGERADYLGNKNLIDAAVKAGVQKFILVSSIGSGNSAGALPPQALETLRPVLIEKGKSRKSFDRKRDDLYSDSSRRTQIGTCNRQRYFNRRLSSCWNYSPGGCSAASLSVFSF